MFLLEGHPDAVRCLAYSPNGKVLASGDQGGGLILWEMKRRRVRRETYLRGAYDNLVAERMSSIAFSADGKLLVTTTGVYPPFVRVWQAAELNLLREWEGGFSADGAAFLPDGQTVVSAGSGDEDDCPLYLWDLTSTKRLPAGRIEDVKLNGNPRTPQKPTLIAPGHDRDILALACSPGGAVVTGGADKTARLWDIPNRREAARRRFSGWVRAVGISPDGKLAALAVGRSVYLWDLTQPAAQPRKLAGHTKTVGAVAFHPRGRILGSGGADGIVRLWDVESGSPLQAFDWGLYWVGALAFAPDGDTAAVGGGTCDIVVFDLDEA